MANIKSGDGHNDLDVGVEYMLYKFSAPLPKMRKMEKKCIRIAI